ncbi:glycosyltransferase family 87 protein [Rhodovulum euryhalinum]|uniref:Uncharacterized protein DUF2029 n=1 Tax=Rhodovulum euryhalinum TaxID=35805 RepID=A0A4R2KZ29_9RHOB|nr:glycosyltransferase family 87 protein [Rhodovulum euryhalinum]TCO71955.1 uncharacterized protein DUF2029 [Rhodovulum euryhalinum]
MAFFNEDRLRTYPRIIVLGYLVSAVLTIGYWLARPLSGVANPGGDFIVFHAAARMAASGAAAQAYDPDALKQVYSTILPGMDNLLGWYYPPVFFLPLEPLAHLPYFAALAAWTTVTAALFALAVRPLIRHRDEAWAIAASAPVFYNLFDGQNGFLTAALVIWAFRALAVRPALAGVALGCLCYKPHLAILFPVLLAALGQWRAIGAAAATVAVAVGLSLVAYGVAPWQAFFAENLRNLSQFHGTAGSFPMARIASPHALVLGMGAGAGTARLVQLGFIAAVAAAILLMARRRVPLPLLFAFTVAAMVPASPHNFLYDWTVLVVPMLVLFREIERTGALAFEKAVMLAVFIAALPLGSLPIGMTMSPGVVVPLALMAVIARRAVRARDPDRDLA